MSAAPSSLEAAAEERKARLARLKSLKRKQDEGPPENDDNVPANDPAGGVARFFSGRNYDPVTQEPKLGFESAPTEGEVTLEDRAKTIAAEISRQQAEDENSDKPLDLFKLQPKKPNWDLKRDLDKKLEVLNVRTENAMAKLVRQRVKEQQDKARARAGGNGATGDGESIGMEGVTLLEGVHLREKEDEENEEREEQVEIS
ncbi:MAG: hypothetical protein M1825_000837 [Sarcosagium campestre]|nr:MAG: hypothetical protein M1825_000837 [Sarcosagium campestre]